MRCLLLLLLVCVSAARAQLEGWEDYELVWEDQFDGTEIDLTKWDHEVTATGGGNGEFQVYTDDPMNSFVRDGSLFIKPSRLMDNINPSTGQPYGENFFVDGVLDLNALYGRCTNTDNDGCYRQGDGIPPVMSARLRTAGRFSFTYGRIKIRARMPTGDWLWPAMWMLPEEWVYGGWPQSGEIDIIEIIGNEDYLWPADSVWSGYQRMGSTLHWGPNRDHNRYYLTTAEQWNETCTYGRCFHDLELDWSEDGFRYVIDGVDFVKYPDPLISENPEFTSFWDYGFPYQGAPNPGWETPNAPFDQAFHFLFNVAVGGTNWFIPDGPLNRGGDPQYEKPWVNGEDYYQAFQKFWARQEDWYWTWTKEGDFNAMEVDYIEVYQKIATP